MVTIEVIGAGLESHYTVREASGDTVSLQEDLMAAPNGIYPVLDDNFQNTLQGRSEGFRFLGLVGDSLVVDELFQIGADECHINYESGDRQVTL